MKTYNDVLNKINRPILCPRVQWGDLQPENLPAEVQLGETEILQWYIIDDIDVDFLISINEPVYFNEYTQTYMWGVCHYGTPWESVPLMFDKAIMPDNFACGAYELSQLLGYTDFCDFCEDGHNAGWLKIVNLEIIINEPRFNAWLKKMDERFRVLEYDVEKKVYNCKGGLL